MHFLFARTIIGAIRKKEDDFILKGEKLEILAETCGVPGDVCDWIRERYKKMKHLSLQK